MKYFVVVVLMAFVGMSAAQCGTKLKQAGDCVEDLANIRFDELRNRDIKGEVKGCFDKSGCTAPDSLPEDEDGEGSMWLEKVLKETRVTLQRLDVLAEEKTTDLVSMKDSFLKCGLQVLYNMKSDSEQCMQTKDKFSDFTSPDFLSIVGSQQASNGKSLDEKLKAMIGTMAEFFGLRLGGLLRGLRERGPQLLVAILDNEVCPTTQNKADMKTCLEGVYDSSQPQISCDGLEACKTKLSGECKSIKKDLVKAMCECSNELIDTKFTDMFSYMKSCLQTELKVDNIIPPGIPEKLAQKMGQKLSKTVLNDFCQKAASSDALQEACS